MLDALPAVVPPLVLPARKPTPPVTPCKLTPEVERHIVKALRAGNFREVSARAGGVTSRSLRRWMLAGKADPESIFGKFRKAVLEAEQAAELRELRKVLSAGAKDWRASAWYLERQFPERWARQAPQRLELTGKDGRPIETEMLHGLTDEERAARIAAILGLDARAGRGDPLAEPAGPQGALAPPGGEAPVDAAPRPTDGGTGEPG